MKTLADKLRQEPGIDVTRLKVGMRLMVETEQAIYEMRVLHQGLSLVEISSSDPVLRQPTVGQFIGSQLPPACAVPNWIGKGLSMHLRFRNGDYFSAPVLSAEVKGDTWHYDLF
jgi:hypothetical protein